MRVAAVQLEPAIAGIEANLEACDALVAAERADVASGARANAARAPVAFARLVGAPVVHASMSGSISCPMPELPRATYRGPTVPAGPPPRR